MSDPWASDPDRTTRRNDTRTPGQVTRTLTDAYLTTDHANVSRWVRDDYAETLYYLRRKNAHGWDFVRDARTNSVVWFFHKIDADNFATVLGDCVVVRHDSTY